MAGDDRGELVRSARRNARIAQRLSTITMVGYALLLLLVIAVPVAAAVLVWLLMT